MADDKPKPIEDLKEGLGLLFRAAKGAVESLPTEKLHNVEDLAKDAAKEVGRAFESLGNEIDKVINKAGGVGSTPPATAEPPKAEPPKAEEKFDDGYAPEPPANKGPRVG